MASVEIRGVKKKYGSHWIIPEPLSICVRSGELMVLVGPSGCGKSTLLRMVAGLEEITDGELWIDGRVVNRLSPRSRGIAMVFQNYALYPHMTVKQNLAFSLKLAKIPPQEIERRVEQTARTLAIEDHLSKKPAQLSGGQKQRVAMGRAMVRQPGVLLFDEPLSNLDAQLRVKMRSEISLLHRRLKSTCIYVTHDQTEAMTLADRIAVMNAGRIIQIGSPLEVFHEPRTKFVASFIGSPAMNFLPVAQLERCSIPNGAQDAGFRPESVRFGRPDVLGPQWVPVGRGRVSLVERLGSIAYAHVQIVGTTVIGEVTTSHAPELETEIDVCADSGALFFFDCQGDRIHVPRQR